MRRIEGGEGRGLESGIYGKEVSHSVGVKFGSARVRGKSTRKKM